MADRSLAPDPFVRLVAFVATVLLHLPLFLATHPRELPASSEPALRVRFIAERTPAQKAEPPTRTADRPRAPRTPRAVEAPSPLARIRTEERRAAADWEIAGAISAQAAIAAIVRDEGHRSLGPREKQHQLIEPEPPRSIFEEPKRRYGDLAPNALDLDSVWHNEYCYTQLEKPVSARPAEATGSVNPVICVMPIGKRAPRGDLFDHLKKTYPDPHPRPAHPPDRTHGTPSSAAPTNQ